MKNILLNLLLRLLMGTLADFVKNVVVELNDADMTNEQKRTSAFAKVKEAAKQTGKDMRDRIINLSIEAAVNLQK